MAVAGDQVLHHGSENLYSIKGLNWGRLELISIQSGMLADGLCVTHPTLRFMRHSALPPTSLKLELAL